MYYSALSFSSSHPMTDTLSPVEQVIAERLLPASLRIAAFFRDSEEASGVASLALCRAVLAGRPDYDESTILRRVWSTLGSWVRRECRRREVETASVRPLTVDPSTDVETTDLLSRLPPIVRRTVDLRVQGHTLIEIARLTGVSPATVNRRLTEARGYVNG